MAENMITRGGAEALIPTEVIAEIMQGVVKQSAAMSMFRKLPNMSTAKSEMKVLDLLPLAYWQTSDTATKKLTNMAWKNKYIYAEEIAVIVPIAENVLADAEYDIWGEVKPRIIEAFAKKFDEAVFTGKDKPSKFRADLISSVVNSGATVTQGSKTLYEAINDAMVKVEESGYNPSGIVGGIDVKGKFRMMLDTNGQPIKGTEIDSLPKAYVDNGAWDKTKAQLIVGDMTQAVYAIRQDITFKLLEEGVIQDPTTGDILYNLAQQDMVALRAVMRIGWEIPNPITALNPDEATRFPFAAIAPTVAPTLQVVTFTVKDGATTSVVVKDANVTFAGQTAKTNASGVATFKAITGDYTWVVKKDSVNPQYGEVTVASGAVAVAVNNFGKPTV